MKKILIYNLVSLGDVIMSTSIIPILRQAWPQAKIGMMVQGANAAVVQNNPQVDDPIIYTYKPKSLEWRPTLKFISELRQHHFDLSISMDRRKRGAVLNWLAGVPTRVGPDYIFNYDQSWAPRLYTHVVKSRLNVDLDSRIEVMQDIARQYTGLSNATGRPSFGVPGPEDRAKAARLLDSLPSSRYQVGLCLQGNLPIRAWPPENFAALIDHLGTKEETACYIIGTAAQKDYADKVIARSNYKAANFCGQTNLKELAALMLASHAFVGVDTGAAHMAAALGAPLLTIFGNATPHQYRPMSGHPDAEAWNLHLWSGRSCSPCKLWNPEECPYNMDCMYDLTVEKVTIELKKLFAMAPRIAAHHAAT